MNKSKAKSLAKGNGGITLIALVITIIVLLILAGVSIAMLAGDNSILQRATDAKKATEDAQAEEEARLAEYNNVINELVNGGANPGGDPTPNPTPQTESTEGIGTVNSSYSNDFGKIVTGYEKQGTWRLFYADSNNAYLIRDSIGNMTINSLSWYGTSSISDLGKNLNAKYTANSSWELKSDGENLNANIIGVAALLDTTKWTDYKASYANWAIGGPTVEMFLASYHSTHIRF